MSKETGFVLMALIFATDFLILQMHKPLITRLRNVLAAWWPFLALALTYVILRATVLNFSNSFNFFNEQNEFTSHISIRLMTFFKAITQYTGFIFFPHHLTVERMLPWGRSLLEPDVLFGGIVCISLVGTALYFWKKLPWLSWGIAWFFIAIAPASNVLVPINAVIYEHFLYVPMIGIVTIVVFPILASRNGKSLVPLAKLLGLILVAFMAINLHRNLDWRTAIGFYEQLIKYRPDSYRVVNNLGMEYADRGFHKKAEETYAKAIALDPKNPVGYHNLGGTYRDTGRMELAIEAFKNAIRLDPKFVFSYRSLAEIYYRQGNLELAREYILAALSITPDDPQARAALGFIESQMGEAPTKVSSQKTSS